MAMLQDMFKICQTHITDVYDDDDDDDKVITYKCLAFNVLVTLASWPIPNMNIISSIHIDREREGERRKHMWATLLRWHILFDKSKLKYVAR